MTTINPKELDLDRCKIKTKKVYKIIWYKTYDKPSDFEVGSIWFMTILSFPIWIWFWLIYKFLQFVGRLFNGVEEIDEEIENETNKNKEVLQKEKKIWFEGGSRKW